MTKAARYDKVPEELERIFNAIIWEPWFLMHCRVVLGLKQDEMGKRMGLRKASIYRWESGMRQMTLRNKILWVQTFGKALEAAGIYQWKLTDFERKRPKMKNRTLKRLRGW